MTESDAIKFKEQCLELLDQLDADGLIITKHGNPVAHVIPYGTQGVDLIGSLRHKIRIRGNVFSTSLRWVEDAQS